MINLLPPDFKDSYHFARRNVSLLKWVVLLIAVLVGLGCLATYGLLTIHQSVDTYQGRVASANTELSKDQVQQTDKQVTNISSTLRLAVKVLSKEVLFSKLITDIGAAMPAGAILTGLNIDQTSGGIDLSAATTNYTTATQTQVNLSDPSTALFSKVDILSIDCSSSAAADPTHPCVAQFRALFNNDNQFLFVNQGSGS